MDNIQLRIEQLKLIIKLLIKIMEIVVEYFPPSTSGWVFYE